MAEAFLRHTNGRDVFLCFGLYPEMTPPGSRKDSCLMSCYLNSRDTVQPV